MGVFGSLASMFELGSESGNDRWPSPGDLAAALDPDTRQTPALDLIDQALIDVDAGRSDRLMIFMPPQEGKSSRVTKVGPLWFLLRHPHWRIVIASFNSDLAKEFGREVRGYVTGNRGVDGTLDLGLRIAPDNGSVSSWRLAGHRGGIRSVGIEGGITGRPADMLIIDDPISNRTQAESLAHRSSVENFYRSTGTARLAPGAPVILIQTRWHQKDLAGSLMGREDAARWRVINIPAQADHRPERGEVDILGRAPGEYMISARVDERTGRPRGPAEWEQIKVEKGSRDWASLYQGRPSPEAGGVLQAAWFEDNAYGVRLAEPRGDGAWIIPNVDGYDDVELCQSWDFTFKDTKGSDFVVGQVWLRRGVHAFLLDQVRGRWSFEESCRQIRALSVKWPQVSAKLVEDKANGPAIMNALRNELGGLIPVEPEGSKYARAAAVSPRIEAGNVHIPSIDLAPWVGDFIEEAKAFPNAANDDMVDSMSQALHRLLLVPIVSGEGFTSDDLLDQTDYEFEAAGIAPY